MSGIDAVGMRWSGVLWRRTAAVVVLVAVGLVAAGADSAASVAPEWTSSAPSVPAAPVAQVEPWTRPSVPDPAPEPGSSASFDTTPAGAAEVPRGPWSWPLVPRPPVLARFDAPEVRWGSGHRGVDLAATPGQEVRAPTDGVVAFRGVVVDRPVLVLETAAGLRITVEPVESGLPVGAPVTTGDVMGTVAATPGHCVPATCVHWGVVRGDTYLDPLQFVTPVRVVLLPLRPP